MRSAPANGFGLYVHVPFCDGKCPYCAFYSVPYDPALADRWLAALAREWQAAAPAPKADTLYIGGGTPSRLAPRQLAGLCRLARSRAGAVSEWTVEVNPGTLDAEKAAILAHAGVTRVSLGAQSFDPAVLRRLGRRHTAGDTLQAVQLLRRAGLNNLSLDLIACVPGCSRAAWRDTLRQALALEPSHVSVYALTSEEGTRLHRAVGQGRAALLSDREQLVRLNLAERVLGEAGLVRYEISNYARPGFECRHNLACWRGAEYLGFGPAAASRRGLVRRTNRPDLAAYLATLESGLEPPRDTDRLTPALLARERVIFGLRMAEGISDETAAGYEPRLETLQAAGLAVRRAGRWALTPRGRNVADAVAVDLIAESG